jgi:hypothetical protein
VVPIEALELRRQVVIVSMPVDSRMDRGFVLQSEISYTEERL